MAVWVVTPRQSERREPHSAGPRDAPSSHPFPSPNPHPNPDPDPDPNPNLSYPNPSPPQIFAEKQLKELKNGRLAMIAVLGELMAQQVSGYGTYEQLGLIVKSLPLPL